MIWFLIAFLTVLLPLIVLLFNKLTCGLCKCSKHLVGKVVIVTGANTGIGYATAKDLAERGARVYLACRSEQKGISAREKMVSQTGNQDVHFQKLDLSSLASVRKFATDFLETEKRLDILVNNAAMYGSKNVKAEDGLLLGMQTNHFGPFLLTCLLLPLLKSSAPSRIINVSSIAQFFINHLDLNNLNMEKEHSFSVSKVYNQSKLCNVLISVELARRLKGSGVTANSCHPGTIFTDIWKDIPVARNFIFILKFFMKNVWEGAQTTIFLAVSPEVENESGLYFADCRQKPASILVNDDLCRNLWTASEKLVQLKP